jgi:decaprenylphospho-beta-D-ribofuranose 2-oxidase
MSHDQLEFVDTLLTGYGGGRHARARVARVRTIEEGRLAIKKCRREGMTIALLGANCSLGDQVLNEGGVVLDLTLMNAIESWDPLTGRICVQAGVRIADILRITLLDGWSLPAIPGSLAVTVGGAIANNVHGKDAAKNGNFGLAVRSLSLLLANGECLHLDLHENSDIFLGAIGGFGLLGVIVKAELQLVRIPSQVLEVETRISGSIEETVADLELSTGREFGQTWLDSSSRGKSAGRGFTKLARFVGVSDPPERDRIEQSLTVNDKVFGIFPSTVLWRSLRPLFMPPMMDFVNTIYYNKARVETWLKGNINCEIFTEFYFFHNNIPNFYSVYQPPGFLEIQALFPKGNGPEVCRNFIELARKCDLVPVLSGMKRHKADGFLISFEGDGFAPAFDFHLRGRDPRKTEVSLRRMFEFVAEQGGKVNLGKDERLPRDLFHVMYPKAAQFWLLKEKLDPNRLFMSDMGRRLFA